MNVQRVSDAEARANLLKLASLVRAKSARFVDQRQGVEQAQRTQPRTQVAPLVEAGLSGLQRAYAIPKPETEPSQVLGARFDAYA